MLIMMLHLCIICTYTYYIYISISLYTYKNIFTNRDIIREAAGYFEEGAREPLAPLHIIQSNPFSF